MKPLATLNRPVLETVDVVTKESTVSFKERTDVTAVPAMGVVAETMCALVLAGEALRKFGGDSLAEVVRNRDGFVAALGETPSAAPRTVVTKVLLGRHDGGRARPPSAGWWPSGWAGPTSTPTPRWRRPPGAPCPSSSPSRARPPSGRPRPRCWPQAVATDGPAVVSVAGGAVLDPANRALIAPVGDRGVAAGRPRHPGRPGGRRGRPAAARRTARPAELARLEAVRRPLYAEVADAVVDVDGLDPRGGGRRRAGGAPGDHASGSELGPYPRATTCWSATGPATTWPGWWPSGCPGPGGPRW